MIGEREGTKNSERRRERERGEMGGGCVEERRRKAEEARLGAPKLKSGQIYLFIYFLNVKDKMKPNKRRSDPIM